VGGDNSCREQERKRKADGDAERWPLRRVGGGRRLATREQRCRDREEKKPAELLGVKGLRLNRHQQEKGR